jgi:hypothetical protein
MKMGVQKKGGVVVRKKINIKFLFNLILSRFTY